MCQPEAFDLDHVVDRTLIVFQETVIPVPDFSKVNAS